MNEKANINQSNHVGSDSHLESLLNACQPEAVDTARIKSLVHARIIGYELERRASRSKVLKAWVAAVACVAVFVGLAVKFMTPAGMDLSRSTLAEVSDAGYIELIVEPGKRAELTLSDGTQLVANSRTRVLYPETFDGDERRIFADGEVFLKVAKDAGKPFIVESNGFDVKVLGTTFNICNTSDSTAQVVLVEGSVEVSTDCDNRVRLKPNYMVDLVNGEVASLTQVDTNDYTLWVDGLLSLHGETLSSLVDRLSEHYGVTIRCERSLGSVKVYGKLDLHDSIDCVLESISEIVPMEIESDGSLIIMRNR